MSEHTAATLTEDIRALAQMLLDHPEAGPIIRDAGVHRDFTDEEEALVGDLARNSPLMELFRPYKTEWGWKAKGAWDSPTVAIGLARQIADGLIESVDSPQATDLIERNKLPPPEPGAFDSPNYPGRQVPFEIFYKALIEFIETPDIKHSLHDYQNFNVADDGYHNHARLRDKLLARPLRHLARYGEIAWPAFLELASAHFGRHVDVYDRDSLVAYLGRHLDKNPPYHFGVDARGAK